MGGKRRGGARVSGVEGGRTRDRWRGVHVYVDGRGGCLCEWMEGGLLVCVAGGGEGGRRAGGGYRCPALKQLVLCLHCEKLR